MTHPLLATGRPDRRGSPLQRRHKLRELFRHALAHRPRPHLLAIKGIPLRHPHRLLQGLPVLPVKEGSQAILDAVGRRQQDQHAGVRRHFVEFLHRPVAHGQRAGRELQEPGRLWMHEIAVILREADFGQRLAQGRAPGVIALAKIQVGGLVAVVAVDRHAAAADQHDGNPLLPEMAAHEGGQLRQGHRGDGFHSVSGLPLRRGRRRLSRSHSCSSGG